MRSLDTRPHQLDGSFMYRPPYSTETVEIPFKAGQSDQDALDAWNKTQPKQQPQKEPEVQKPKTEKKKPSKPLTLSQRVSGLEMDVGELREIEEKLDKISTQMTNLEPKLVTDANLRQRVEIIYDKVGNKTTLRDEIERFTDSVNQKMSGFDKRLRDASDLSSQNISALSGRIDSANNARATLAMRVGSCETVERTLDAKLTDSERNRLAFQQAQGRETQAIKQQFDELLARLDRVERENKTLLAAKLELLDRVAKLEGAKEVEQPSWTRGNGKKVLIKDMNQHHLKNAILECIRGERDVPALTFRNLCAEAEKRGLDWKSWTPNMEPDTKYATTR